MGHWRVPAAFIALYTLVVVGTTRLLERRDRLDCIPHDQSCNDLNSANVLVYEVAGFFAWMLGVLVIVYFARRNAEHS